MEILLDKAGRNARVAHVDSKFVSPERRAQYLYAKLQELEPKPTMWDMVCLASEILGVVALMEPAFNEVAKRALAITYEVHYIHGTDLTSCLSTQLLIQPLTKADKDFQSKTGAEQELK